MNNFLRTFHSESKLSINFFIGKIPVSKKKKKKKKKKRKYNLVSFASKLFREFSDWKQINTRLKFLRDNKGHLSNNNNQDSF